MDDPTHFVSVFTFIHVSVGTAKSCNPVKWNNSKVFTSPWLAQNYFKAINALLIQ